MIPLLLSRRDKCKKTNIAQCMLHELSACAVKAVVWGFVFLFTLDVAEADPIAFASD